ncbi:MAG: hypothetical protein VX764_04525 [Planctomycetota bacterium]|nr:hypothetical protein [Planctomycetota bacterium]
MILMAILLLLLLVTLYGVGRLRGDLLTRGPVKLALSPGLLPDSLARTLACLATATPIIRLSPWRDDTPFLVEGECPVKRIGVPLATAFRLLVLFAAFVSVVLLLPVAAATVPDPETLSHAYEKGIGTLLTTVLVSPFAWLGTGLISWWTLAWLGSMVLAAGLRPRETGCALLVGGGVIALLEGAHWLGLKFGAFSNGWFLQRFYEADAGRALVLLVIVSLITLSVLAAMHWIPMVVQRMRPRPIGWDEQKRDRIVIGS